MSFAAKGGKMYKIKTNKRLILSYKNYLQNRHAPPYGAGSFNLNWAKSLKFREQVETPKIYRHVNATLHDKQGLANLATKTKSLSFLEWNAQTQKLV